MSVTRCSTPLTTDLYQLTMAQAYHAAGFDDVEGCFHMFFRSNPFGGGFALAAGLEQALDYLSALTFSEEDLSYLAEQLGNDGRELFSAGFLAWLRELEFKLDVDAIPEGTVVFPREPLMRVCGPIAQAQLVETALLNVLNFQTLVATKAARVCMAAQGDPVLEFGLRRAQGPDGGLSASRAAYIGGCSSTSNTEAGTTFGIPVAGTHAHSWVMAFDTETEAFRAYAEAMPNNCTFLVDTYDTLQGVANAITVGSELRTRGHEMIGIRIDSGDLAWLSVRARAMLDAAGFPRAKIVASNELDEHTIVSLKDQGARIDVWGVGTKLATAYDQPALGGVYKLSAIRRPGGEWTPRIKISEQIAKMNTPGVLGVRRYYDEEGLDGDMIYDVHHAPTDPHGIVHPEDSTRRKSFVPGQSYEELLAPALRQGQVVGDSPSIRQIRERSIAQVASLDASITRFMNPHSYPVGLETSLHATRARLVLEAKGIEREGGMVP